MHLRRVDPLDVRLKHPETGALLTAEQLQDRGLVLVGTDDGGVMWFDCVHPPTRPNLPGVPVPATRDRHAALPPEVPRPGRRWSGEPEPRR